MKLAMDSCRSPWSGWIANPLPSPITRMRPFVVLGAGVVAAIAAAHGSLALGDWLGLPAVFSLVAATAFIMIGGTAVWWALRQ